jgi:hypothetical protein
LQKITDYILTPLTQNNIAAKIKAAFKGAG